LLFTAAVAWFALSYFWSPYERPDQALKLLILTPLFAGLVVSAAAAPPQLTRSARASLAGAAVFGLLILGFEALNSGAISYSYKVGVEGWTGDRGALDGVVNRLLGRGATPLMLLAGPAALLAWTRGDRFGKGVAAVLLALACLAAAAFDTDANVAACLAAIVAAGLALRWPAMVLRLSFLTAGLSILLAPILLPAAMALIGEDLRSAMPTSWIQRLEIWRVILDRVAERPLTGWGLDSVRALSSPGEVRGVAFDRIPLHAHNAGLHIWMETGLIGAGLSSAALLALARAPLSLGRRRAASLLWVLVVWFVSVQVGYGVWQEWHHGALALALAAAFLVPGRIRR